jgi:hypothetical protein
MELMMTDSINGKQKEVRKHFGKYDLVIDKVKIINVVVVLIAFIAFMLFMFYLADVF